MYSLNLLWVLFLPKKYDTTALRTDNMRDNLVILKTYTKKQEFNMKQC